MKQRPILFSTPMVQAILAGRKTQTRRVVKEPKGFVGNWLFQNIEYVRSRVQCPYGKPGDVLWVRESWQHGGMLTSGPGYVYKSGNYPKGMIKWKPSIHMPKDACRIWLEIVSVRVERLNEISDSDALAEGIETWFDTLFQENRFRDYVNDTDRGYRFPTSSFFSLWSKINGEQSLNSNPFVWVVEFKQINKPQ